MRRLKRFLHKTLRGAFLGLILNALIIAPALAASTYVVEPGDTFYQIATANNISLGSLEAANPGTNPELIHPGQSVVLPSPGQNTNDAIKAAYNFGPRDVNLLSQMIAAEASDQPYQAQVGVGAVIMNRLASSNFPKTLPGVIFQPGQFTSVSNGWFYNAQPTATSNQAAQAAIAGQNPVKNALYFYEPGSSSDSWIFTQPIVTQIGTMDFSL